LAAYLRSQAYNKYGKQDAIMNAGFFWMWGHGLMICYIFYILYNTLTVLTISSTNIKHRSNWIVM
jgi:hypothetical protein